VNKLVFLALLFLLSVKTALGADGTGDSAPAPDRPPEVTVKSSRILELESRVRDAEGKLKAIQGQITVASMDLQLARIALETAETGDRLKTLKEKKDRKSRDLAGALELKIRNLTSMANEDFPALKELEANFTNARIGSDPVVINAAQQALNARRLVLSRKQTEVEAALARADGDETRAKMLETRLDQIRRQEQNPDRPAVVAPTKAPITPKRK
jgi:hypothetical protein